MEFRYIYLLYGYILFTYVFNFITMIIALKDEARNSGKTASQNKAFIMIMSLFLLFAPLTFITFSINIIKGKLKGE